MSQDDEIRLNFKIDGSDDVGAMQARMAALKVEGVELARAMRRGEVSFEEFGARMKPIDAEIRSLEQATRILTAAEAEAAAAAEKLAEAERHQAAAAKDAGTAARQLGQAVAGSARPMGEMTAGMGRASNAGANLGQSLLQSGRFIQDFFQGGVGGVLNNVEGLTIALGLGSGMAGALTIAGVAASIAGPKIIELFRSLQSGGSFAVPKATEGIEAFQKQVSQASKELDELREKARLSFDELQRFYELEYQERTGKEKGAAAKAADAFAGGMTAEQSEYASAAKTVWAKFGGGDNLKKAIQGYVEKELGVVLQAAYTEITTDLQGNRKVVEHPAVMGYRDLKTGTYTNTAEGTANQFMEQLSKGDQSTYKFLGNRALKGAGGDLFNAHDPETIKAIDKANREEEQSIAEAERQGAQERQDEAKAEQDARAEKDRLDRQREKEKKEADRAAEDEAKRLVENPERTIALHGPEALADAMNRLDGGLAGGGRRGAGVGGRVGGGGILGGGGGEMPEADQVAGRANNPFLGLKGTKLKNAKRAAVLKARKEAKANKAIHALFSNARKRPLQNTAVSREGRGPAPVDLHPAAAGPPRGQRRPDAAGAGDPLALAGRQLDGTAKLIGVATTVNARLDQLMQRQRQLDMMIAQLQRDTHIGQRPGGRR